MGIIVVRSSKIPARKNIGCLNGVHRAVIFAIALQLSCMRRCHVYCESEEVDCYLEWSGLAGWSVVSAWQLHLGASLLPGLPSVIIIIQQQQHGHAVVMGSASCFPILAEIRALPGKSPLCLLCCVVSQIPLQRLVWQLPRPRASYGEKCVMDLGHNMDMKSYA